MAKEEIILKFNFSYGELVAQSIEKQGYLNRDLVDLTPRGVSTTEMNEFAALHADFLDTTEDGILVANLSGAVAQRDAMHDSLMLRIRDVAGVASLALGAQSADYRSFQYSDINELDPSQFLIRAESICDQADTFSGALASKGITPAMILDIRNDLPSFSTLIKNVGLAKADRDNNTQKRRTAANNLYIHMASLSEIAKVYYQDRDEALYNDYIIYSSSETAQTRTGRLSANEIKTRELIEQAPEVDIICELESDGKIDIYFSQTTNGEPASIFATLNAFEKKTFNFATNLGYDASVQATHFTIRNASTNQIIYRMRIE